MVIDDKAWSNSLTALVRQLYHSSKARVKQYQHWALHEGIRGPGWDAVTVMGLTGVPI